MDIILVGVSDEALRTKLDAAVGESRLVIFAGTFSELLEQVRDKPIDLIVFEELLVGRPVATALQDIFGIDESVSVIVFSSQPAATDTRVLPRPEAVSIVPTTIRRDELAHELRRQLHMVRIRRENRALREQATQLRAKSGVPEEYLKHVTRESYSHGRSSQMESLKAFHRAITNIRDLDELCEALVEAIAECFSVGSAALVLEEGAETLGVKACRGLEGEFVRKIELRPREGIYRWLKRRGEILLAEQLEGGESPEESEPIRKEAALLRAKVCVPLAVNGTLIGFLALGGRVTGATFTEAELTSLYAMAADAAAAIANAKAFGEFRSRKASLESILQTVRCGVVATDAESVIIAVNKAAAEMVGLSPEEASGAHAQTLGSALADIVWRTLKEQRESRAKVLAPVTKRPLDVSAGVLKNENGTTVGMVMVLTDETLPPKYAAKVHEEMIRRISDRMSHYIGNKLVPIYGFFDKPEQRYDNPELLREIDKKVKEPAQALRNLVDRLAELTEPITLQPAEHDLELVLNEFVSEKSQTAAEKGINVTLRCELEDKRAVFDKEWFRRALALIFDNAAEAFPPGKAGSRIELVAREPREQSGLKSRDAIEILVTDNGRGIDPADLESVFEPFYTNKEGIAVGMGLGLPLARKIIEAHGGAIDIESKKDEGTTVRIALPRRGART
ncbi:MAG: hypothetical protein Kow0099_09280 [Candidatus Abyssubacteria bacterium]